MEDDAMLEPYRQRLEQLRHAPLDFADLCYDPKTRTESPGQCRNHVRRYGVLLALQYDLREDDHLLVRALFEAETGAREEDRFQEATAAFQLGAYLLATFRRAADLPLFARAKLANFDTHRALHSNYLCLFGMVVLEEYLATCSPVRYEALRTMLDRQSGTPSESDLPEWWRGKQAEYPGRAASETPLQRFKQAWELREVELARPLLDAWEETQPWDERTLNYLKDTRLQLGQPDRALEAARGLLELAGSDPWDRARRLQDLAEPLRLIGQLDEALAALIESVREVKHNSSWRGINLTRRIADEMLEVALAEGRPDPLARSALDAVGRLVGDGVPLPLNLLMKARDAAARLGDTPLAAQYEAQAAREKERIDKGFYKKPGG